MILMGAVGADTGGTAGDTVPGRCPGTKVLNGY